MVAGMICKPHGPKLKVLCIKLATSFNSKYKYDKTYTSL
jgi:hypothetical protein